METKGNYVLIGLFALSVVVAAFAFVFWFHNIGGTAKRTTYQVRFEGSAGGLRNGSTVLFNGIRIGEVTKVLVDPEDPHRVLALIEVDVRAPIRTDTAVGLEFQGLTGIASIALTGGSPTAPQFARFADEPPMLIADASGSHDVMRVARDVMKRVDDLLAENGTLYVTFKNVEAFTQTLKDNRERVENILAGLENLSGGPNGEGDIQDAARSIKQLADNLDKRTAEIAAGVNRFTATGAREISNVSADARRTLSEIDRAVKNFDRNPSRLIFGGSGNAVPTYNGGGGGPR
jgi:phospholipid/cholesterol/gamma-HCH transport system substrate-binding protein